MDEKKEIQNSLIINKIEIKEDKKKKGKEEKDG